MCHPLATFGVASLMLTATLFADEPPTVAGRTVAQYADDLGHEDRVVRLRAVKSLGVFGDSAAVPLREALGHEDAAVRYTAAVHLGRLGGKVLESCRRQMLQLADDERSFAVRMAASFALCRLGLLKEHLPVLIQGLAYPERGMSCSAAELIGQLGPAASAAIEPLQRVYERHRPGVKGGDYHIGGAAKNALRKVQPLPRQ